MNTIKNKLKAKIKGGFYSGVGLGIGLLTTGLFAAAYSMNIFSPGDVISAAKINKNFAIAAPEGAVMAFYLPDCPDGWTLADGTLGTPDLRGRFIRGLDSRAEADGGNDPDGPRAMGSFQADAFQSWQLGADHDDTGARNYYGVISNRDFTSSVTAAVDYGAPFFGRNVQGPGRMLRPMNDGTHGDPRISNETRPENIALIYCMRKN
jgi:hypothetical protein